MQAIATVHDLLSQDEDLRMVDARAVMDRLVPRVLRSSGVSAELMALRMDVQSIPLSSKRANVLALIVNELVSNAVKHACKERTGSELELSLRQDSEELVLHVEDNGPGLPENFSRETHSLVSTGLAWVRLLIPALSPRDGPTAACSNGVLTRVLRGEGRSSKGVEALTGMGRVLS
jgi:two-component sensor histidine kinase